MTQQIPLVDLSLQTTEVELEVTEGIAEVIRSGAYVLAAKGCRIRIGLRRLLRCAALRRRWERN